MLEFITIDETFKIALFTSMIWFIIDSIKAIIELFHKK